MSRASTKALIRALAEEWNEEMRSHFLSLGDGKQVYTRRQKDYALSLIDTYGVRATSRILKIPRRTIQRWCQRCNKLVKRCPSWVYEWAEAREKRREFWEHRGL
ncbi:hypothetical protein ACFLYR_02920 [Chloroflexota bacterium]